MIGAVLRVVLVEQPHLRRQVHAAHRDIQGPLHHLVQSARERLAAGARRRRHGVGVRLLVLGLQALGLLAVGELEVLQLVEDGLDGVVEEHLYLLRHVARESVEADRAQVLGLDPLRLQLLAVLCALVRPHLHERLRGRLSVLPEGQRKGEADQRGRQVAVALDPLVDVGWLEVGVVFVELVADQDRPLEGGVELATLGERGHGRRVPTLLHAQHHVPGIRHEPLVQLLDFPGELFLAIVDGEIAEARQVDDLHVNAAGRLDAHPAGICRYGLAQLLVRLSDLDHHLRDGVLVPLVGGLVPHEPLGSSCPRHVPELQDRRPPAAQGAGNEIEGLSREGLYQAALAHRLLAEEDELRQGEVDVAELVLHSGLHVA
mmetsp:Transcript_5789/g.16253  ORF Transcript_5789/g.16253 Transcript_5789/m.16253 type:complete len:374 (-) Transcript_5789:150-1271(-)